jgi:uncharacterized protein (TIGR02996 family)
MSSDRDSLLAAIRAHPEEDTPRLMFADWLEEHGDEVRAEFVRLQCELARLDSDGSDSQTLYEFLCESDYVTRPAADWTQIDDGIHRRLALSTRAKDLEDRFAKVWTPKVPRRSNVTFGSFRRGFPHALALPRGKKLETVAPVIRDRLPAFFLHAHDFDAEFVAQLRAVQLADRLAGLYLTGACAPGLEALGKLPDAASVRTLELRAWDAPAALAAVAGAPHFAGLRALNTREISLNAADAETVFRTKHLRGLTRLHLRGDGEWSLDTVRAFADAGFASLTSLRFVRVGMGDDGARVLARCAALKNVTDLDLGHNALTGAGVTELLCSKVLTKLAFLGIEYNAANGLDAKKLAAARPAALRMLHAHGCRFRTADVRALARSPRLRTLWYLDLDSNGIGTPAVRELVRGFRDFCPPILWMTYNRIDDRGAQLLADWPAAAQLRVLHLKHNDGLTGSGARALLESPHLTKIDSLGVPLPDGDDIARIYGERFRKPDAEY